MLPGVLSNPELKRSTDVIYSAVCKELCIALVEEMDGAGIRAAAHTSAQPSHGPGATRFSGSFPQPCSPPCSAFSRENTAELAHLCACKAQQKPVKHLGAAALSRLLTLRAHPDSLPASTGQPACGLPGFPSPALASSGLFPLLDRAVRTH